VGGDRERPPRFSTAFPSHLDPADVSIKFAGAGGDGAQTLALLTARSAINEGFDATYIPSYGPESRGGTSYADVHVASTEVLSPAAPEPHVLVVFNRESLAKFGPRVRPGGIVLYDSAVIQDPPALDPSVRVVGIPFTRLALELGAARVKNIVALGAFQAATRLVPAESFRAAIGEALRSQCALLPLNEQAFALGGDALAAAAPPEVVA
jgi:Pyruvate/2-oxoacid:ferredoxin oxidoreductase gamma subunit